MVAYRKGDWQKATKAFERALRSPCGSATEHDFGDFMLEKSRYGALPITPHRTLVTLCWRLYAGDLMLERSMYCTGEV